MFCAFRNQVSLHVAAAQQAGRGELGDDDVCVPWQVRTSLGVD